MSQTNNNNTASPSDLEKAYQSLMNMSGQSSLDSLKAAWNYLQVYSTWCEKLPNTEANLNATLKISSSAPYSFYPAMLDAYQSTSKTGFDFLNNIFPKVVNIGNDLQSFAQTAGSTADEGGIFASITTILDTITPTTDPADANNIIQKQVLPLLQALQAMADQNESDAKEVVTLLSKYKSDLNSADQKLSTVDTEVTNDASVSQATIDTLSGGPEIQGSIAQLEALKKDQQAEYQKDVTIACTTVTYAWVGFPICPVGLITAATVAGVYGKKATDMLKQDNETSDLITTDQNELATAISVHNVQSLAKSGLDSAVKYTDQAIVQTTTVQNNWNTISSNLLNIQTELNNTTFGQGSDEKARGKILINVFLKQATTHWQTMIPLVNALVANPYIAVISGDVSATDLLKKINSST